MVGCGGGFSGGLQCFQGRKEGGGGQSSPTDYKVGLWGIDCQFTTKEEGGWEGGGGNHENITRPYEGIW